MRPLARTAVLLVLVCFVFVAASDALACPMCKAALASHDRAHGDWVGGFFWSILFMLSMPFVLLGSFSTYMYVLVRRARRETAERDRLQREAAQTEIQETLLEPELVECGRSES